MVIYLMDTRKQKPISADCIAWSEQVQNRVTYLQRKYALLISTVAVGFLTTVTATAQEPPAPPLKTDIESVLAKSPQFLDEGLRNLKIVLLASDKDHGLHEHDYPLWQKNWSLLLGGSDGGSDAKQVNMFGPARQVHQADMKNGAPNVKVSTAWDWPTADQFRDADLIVAFSVINWNPERNMQLRDFLNRGGGFVPIHMSCVVADGTGLDDEVVDMIGLSWHWDYTRWRHGPMNLEITEPQHPICLGLPEQLYFMDEAYWPLYGDRSRIGIIGTSKETNKKFALRDEDGKIDFSNMEAIQQKWPEEPTKDEPIFWTYQYGKGRVFGSILGHYSWTFDDPYFRILILRGMAWAAGEPIYRFDNLVMRGARIK